jgi:hypothetical protein
LLFVAVSTGRAGDLSRTFERSFPAPSERISMHVTRGVVEVVNGPAGGEVKLSVVLGLRDGRPEGERRLLERLTPDLLAPLKRSADQAFAAMEPRTKADARRVQITVRDSRGLVVDKDPALQMTIQVRLEVPKGAHVVITSVAAGVSVDDFEGTLDLRGEQGSCFLKSVKGDVSARALSGSITAVAISGKATLKTASGNIFVGKLHGPSRLSTANGSIEVSQAFDRLVIDGKDAEIIVGLSPPLAKGMDLRTSAGSITLNIDRDLPVTIDADTFLLGKVRARGIEPVLRRGTLDESSVLADLNGGGKPVRVRTKWGKVLLVGREPIEG